MYEDTITSVRQRNGWLWDIIGLHVLLPSQYYEPVKAKKAMQSERRLMLAILEDAIDCLQIRSKIKRRIKKTVYRETVEWLKSEDDGYVFSFQNICDVLNIDASKLRKEIFRRLEENEKMQPMLRIPARAIRSNVQAGRLPLAAHL